MRASLGLAAIAAAVSSPVTATVFQGFNYGSTFTTGAAKQQPDFEAEFRAAKELPGVAGHFTSARLYTMVQAGTTNEPIAAIPAAINSGTSLLLGLWASAGDTAFANEMQALESVVAQYGSGLAGLLVGISVGSEDLYRVTATAAANGEKNPGATPDTLTGYIKQVRDAVANTPLAQVPVGHVDTWTAWANGSNKAVIGACDFLGMDAYPYFQDTMANAIGNGKSLFDEAFAATKAAAGGKPVWVTETGFPISGKTVNQAVPSTDNARTYWDQVGCSLFGSTNTWWFTLQDADPTTPNPSFGLITALTNAPLYNLSCADAGAATSTTVAASTASSSQESATSDATSTATSTKSAATGVGFTAFPSVPNRAASVSCSSISALVVAMMAVIAI